MLREGDRVRLPDGLGTVERVTECSAVVRLDGETRTVTNRLTGALATFRARGRAVMISPRSEGVALTLETETPESVTLRRARAADMRKIVDRQTRPLAGTAGDLTADLFGAQASEMPLFAAAAGRVS